MAEMQPPNSTNKTNTLLRTDILRTKQTLSKPTKDRQLCLRDYKYCSAVECRLFRLASARTKLQAKVLLTTPTDVKAATVLMRVGMMLNFPAWRNRQSS